MDKWSVLFLLFASPAFAAPAVGDWAEFQTTITDHGTATTTVEWLGLVSYDASSDTFVMRTVDTVNGVTSSKDQSFAKSALESDDQLAQELHDCFWHDIGGAAVPVSTPAGLFQSCRFHHREKDTKEDATAWLANVPFGFVRVTVNRPDYAELREMIAYGRGQ
jgi:hypothetical protein